MPGDEPVPGDQGGAGGAGAAVDAGGPRIDPSTAQWDGDSVVVTASGTFLEATLAAGTAVTSIDPGANGGWTELSFTASFDSGRGALTFTLDPAPESGLWIRILVRGTGASPVMGAPLAAGGPPVAFAGPAGGLPADGAEGADVAFLIKRS